MKSRKSGLTRTLVAMCRVTLLGATAMTGLGALHLLVPPAYVPFDTAKDYGPNAVQKEFIRLNASQFRYLAFGDTDHRKVENKMFVLSDGVMSALQSAGVKDYFLEEPYRYQEQMDAVREGGADFPIYSSWNCNQDAKTSVVKAFTNASRAYKGIHFVAADRRFAGEGYSGLAGAYRSATLRYPIDFYRKLHGCWSTHAFVLPAILNFGMIMGPLTDDNPTAEGILSHSGKGALFYGAGHFEAEEGMDKSMRGLLAQGTNTIVVMNVFRDAASESDHKYEGKKPDAILYVYPPQDAPDGIRILNPALSPAYEQAKKNVQTQAARLSMR